MQMNDRGLLIVLSGPSGVGKGTLLKEIMNRNSSIFVSVSATTRCPREGEIDGVNYHFVTKDDFRSMVENGDMLEYAMYSGNFYGTPKSTVEEELAKGHDVVLEIEVQGAMQIKEKLKEAVLLFVMPPSYEELKNRLAGRGTETEQEIKCRLDAAKEEIAKATRYDYVIVNDDLNDAVLRTERVLLSAKCAGSRMKKLVENILLAD